MEGVEFCRFDEILYAIIVRSEFHKSGITFFSPPDLSQQLAYMSHPTGKQIAPHRHNKLAREVHYTQEVLIIREGELRVDFYTELETYIDSRMLRGGDVILLCNGGHGFEVLADVKMLEVKQGPYSGDADKTRFAAAEPDILLNCV